MKHLMNLMWLELDRRTLDISILGALFICIAYLCTNSINYIGDILTTKLFCVFLAIGLILFSFGYRKNHWFLKTFFKLSLYNLFDEAIGRACIIDLYEVLGALLLLFYNWKIWKS